MKQDKLNTLSRGQLKSSGEFKSQTTWHRCIAFGKLAEYAATLTQCVHVQIEGEIRTREYTPTSGKKHAVTQGL